MSALIRIMVLVLAAIALAGCAPSGGQAEQRTTAAEPTGVPVGTVVMVIRHAEKPDGSSEGIDAQGKPDDSSLTAVGWQRADRLADLFDPMSGQLRPGLARPAAIYAAGANDAGEGQRTRETVAPLATRLGITVNTDFGKSDEKKLVAQVTTEPGPTLISWQHEGLPDIAKAFPNVTPEPPADWPDETYDVIWTFTRTADGWQFAQLPELLLPQDQDSVIKD
jgi:broad specificity phosphatase PhoE